MSDDLRLKVKGCCVCGGAFRPGDKFVVMEEITMATIEPKIAHQSCAKAAKQPTA